MPSTTITEVAKLAGVSVATVSRVFSGRDRVSPELAARVRSAADQTGYRPNAIARSLRTKTTQSIALLIPDLGNPYFTELARGIVEALDPAGYSLILCYTDDDPAKERHYLDVVADQRVAGAIVTPASPDAPVESLVQHDIPVVAIDRPVGAGVDTVLVRDRDAAYRATRHLIDEGWERPALITGPANAATAHSRLAGYRTAVTESPGIEPIFAHAGDTEVEGRRATMEMMQRPTAPDALLLASSVTAIGVISALHGLGLSVGKDVGLAVFDDPSWAQWFSPSVTTVVQPARAIGAKAAEMLIGRIEGKTGGPPERHFFDAHLVPRDSSRRLGS